MAYHRRCSSTQQGGCEKSSQAARVEKDCQQAPRQRRKRGQCDSTGECRSGQDVWRSGSQEVTGGSMVDYVLHAEYGRFGYKGTKLLEPETPPPVKEQEDAPPPPDPEPDPTGS